MATIVQQPHPAQSHHTHHVQSQMLNSHIHQQPIPQPIPPPPHSNSSRPTIHQPLPTHITHLPPIPSPSPQPHHHSQPNGHEEKIPFEDQITPKVGQRALHDDPEHDLDQRPSRNSDRKRPRVLMEQSTAVAADDRHDWYYPAAHHYDEDNDEFELNPGAPSGNWGNKRVKGARWVRRGKLSAWGPGRAEWELEDRARKRLKRIIPDRPAPESPPLPTLAHLRSPTPPLIAPYALPTRTHGSYTSFLVESSVQHTYNNTTLASLRRTATEFIEGEGALRTALGALWHAMACEDNSPRSPISSSPKPEDPSLPPSRMSTPSSSTKSPEELLVSSLTPLRQLFVSTSPVFLGGESGQQAALSSVQQKESFDWAVGALRDLADDAREYMERLEEVRDLTGRAEAVRDEVWKVVKERALEEMEEEERQEEEDGNEF